MELGAKEDKTTGGRRLVLTGWLSLKETIGPTDRCRMCTERLLNTVGNFRLRVTPAVPIVFPFLWPSGSDYWRVSLPPELGVDTVTAAPLTLALQTMRDKIPESWVVSQPSYKIVDHSAQFDESHFDGLDGTMGQRRRATMLERTIELHGQDIENFLGQAASMRASVAASKIDLERTKAAPGEQISRSRLETFLNPLMAIRRWELDARQYLRLDLWPVKLYSSKHNVSILTTPHSWLISPSAKDGFSFEVSSGLHPHYSERRYCAGNHANQLYELLARGNLLQAIRLMLELRRGWDEDDPWISIQAFTEKVLVAFDKSAEGYQFYEDGLTGEILPFLAKDAHLIGRRA